MSYSVSVYIRNSASGYNGRVVKAMCPVKTRRNYWAGDTSLVGAGIVGSFWLERFHSSTAVRSNRSTLPPAVS